MADEQLRIRKIGYARVSTDDQNLEMQIKALEEAGCDKIFSEKVSSQAKRRPQYNLMLKMLRPGRVVIVWKLDRLARNAVELLRVAQRFEDEEVELRCLTQPIDTTTAAGKAFFAMTAIWAEFETNLIAERTKEGVRRAQERGVRFGAPLKFKGAKKQRAEDDIRKGKLSLAKIAKRAGISVNTLQKHFPRKERERLRSEGLLDD